MHFTNSIFTYIDSFDHFFLNLNDEIYNKKISCGTIFLKKELNVICLEFHYIKMNKTFYLLRDVDPTHATSQT